MSHPASSQGRPRSVLVVLAAIVLGSSATAGAVYARAQKRVPETAAAHAPVKRALATRAATRRPARTSDPLSIVWAGDTTLGSRYGLARDHGWPQLAGVARRLRAADVSALNSEGTFSVRGTPKCPARASSTCFAFQAPVGNAAALQRAGVDVANLANNHAFDFGARGMGQTVRALRRRGVAVTGRPGEIHVERAGGERVAFVGFSTYRWSSSMTDLPGVRRLVSAADAEADVVVALFHAGAEGIGNEHTPTGSERAFGEYRGDVRAFAHAAVDAGADLVLGSGPHVLRGLERYRGRAIAYSLGNLTGYHNFATGGLLSLSAILRVTLAPDGRMLRGRLDSLTLDGAGVPHEDRGGAAARLVSRLGRADFGSAALVVDGKRRVIGAGAQDRRSARAAARRGR